MIHMLEERDRACSIVEIKEGNFVLEIELDLQIVKRSLTSHSYPLLSRIYVEFNILTVLCGFAGSCG